MSRSPEEITRALAEPFPPQALKRRNDRGATFTYVEGHTVFRRLIDATGNCFDVAVIEQSIEPYGQTSKGAERVIITARVRLTIPELGSREHMGVQVTSIGSGEDLYKGAISDAIKKAATLFGVGLDLYGPDYEAGEIEDRPVSQRATPRHDAPVGSQLAPGRMKPHPAWERIVRIVEVHDIQEESLAEYFAARGFDPLRVPVDMLDKFASWCGSHTKGQIQRHLRDVIAESQQPPLEHEQMGMSDEEIHAISLATSGTAGNDRFSN